VVGKHIGNSFQSFPVGKRKKQPAGKKKKGGMRTGQFAQKKEKYNQKKVPFQGKRGREFIVKRNQVFIQRAYRQTEKGGKTPDKKRGDHKQKRFDNETGGRTTRKSQEKKEQCWIDGLRGGTVGGKRESHTEKKPPPVHRKKKKGRRTPREGGRGRVFTRKNQQTKGEKEKRYQGIAVWTRSLKGESKAGFRGGGGYEGRNVVGQKDTGWKGNVQNTSTLQSKKG